MPFSNTMTLTPINADATLWSAAAITINRPLPGYTAEIHLVIEAAKSSSGRYFFFDNDGTGASDYRICRMKTQLPVSQKQALNAFINSQLATLTATHIGARCLPFRLSIGTGEGSVGAADPCDGFYPFGPDLNWNPCTVWLVVQEQGGELWRPFRFFEDNLTFILVSPTVGTGALAINAPSGIYQGPLSLAGVSQLMFPKGGFKAGSNYSFETGLSLGGVPYGLDRNTDNYVTSFGFRGNLQNSARLLRALLAARAGDISLITNSGFPFGADNPESGTFTCKLLGSEKADSEIVLKMTHEAYTSFTMPISLFLEGVS